jgi:actin-like ATPase involved in cell morphogenesis
LVTGSYTLGVDLGTVYTAAASARGTQAAVVDLGDHSAAIPSVVCLTDDGTFLVGDEANRRALTDPSRVAREFKRRLGDPVPLLIGGTPMSAEALQSELLRYAVARASNNEGGRPNRLVLTHPASWGPMRLDLVRETARLAGVTDALTLSEPIAAAYSYGARGDFAAGDTVAVYDLGGGTFDASIVRWTDTGLELIGEPVGIEHLGGLDFDAAVVAHVVGSLSPELDDADPEDATMATVMYALRQQCVEAKEALSTDTRATVSVMLPSGMHTVRITRSEFETLLRPALARSVEILDRAIRNAGLLPGDLRCVLLSGGSSRMPLVTELLSSTLERPIVVHAHPKYVVALGAALAIERGAETASSAATPPVAPEPAVLPVPDPIVASATFLGPTAAAIDPASAVDPTVPTSTSTWPPAVTAPPWTPSPPPAPPGTPTPATRRPGGLAVGVAVGALLLAVFAIVRFGSSGSSSASSNRSGATTGTSPRSSSPATTATSTTVPGPQRFASQLDSVLAPAPSARAEVVNAVNQLGSCAISSDSAIAALNDAINIRQMMLTQLQQLDTSLLPQGGDAVNDLQQAFNASISADRSFISWAQFVAENGCNGNAAHNSDFDTANSSSMDATTAKNAFLSLWDPVATQLGSKQYLETDL